MNTSFRSPLRLRHGLTELAVTIVLAALALLIILPLVLPFLFVFKTQLEYARHPWDLPKELNLKNFVDAWNAVEIGVGLWNTLIVALGAIVFTLPPAALAGYVFAKYRSAVTETLFYVILVGYFVPVQMVLIPLFRLSMSVGLTDTLPGVFLPIAAFGIPFWVMIYRSFFEGIPKALNEAAHIDGAGHSKTFFAVMLPLAQPATVLAVILVFIGAWSDYLLSLIMLNKPALFTMQLKVAQFLNAYGADRMPRYAAAALISVAPTLLLYIVGHKWIIKGTLGGALKE
jgi:ABC-type glycerol-3-phosphate transport system permease component